MGSLIHILLFLACLPLQGHLGHVLPPFCTAGDAVPAMGALPLLWCYRHAEDQRPPMRWYTLVAPLMQWHHTGIRDQHDALQSACQTSLISVPEISIEAETCLLLESQLRATQSAQIVFVRMW